VAFLSKRVVLLVLIVVLVVAAAVWYFFLRPYKLEVDRVIGGEIVEEGGKRIIEVKYHTYFKIVFKTTPPAVGYKVVCFCDTINFTKPHPLKGKTCGGYCNKIASDGKCVSEGWYADAPPGIVMGLKCYVARGGEVIKGSELTLYLRTRE